MKYFLMILFVVIIICWANGCENMVVEQRGGKVVENASSLIDIKKIECDGHIFYLKGQYKTTPMYIHSYECQCGYVTSVDSTLCKLYGLMK